MVQGVSGDEDIIKGQSYLSLLGFGIGDFGPNKNGVDGSLRNTTKSQMLIYQYSKGLGLAGNVNAEKLKNMEGNIINVAKFPIQVARLDIEI